MSGGIRSWVYYVAETQTIRPPSQPGALFREQIIRVAFNACHSLFIPSFRHIVQCMCSIDNNYVMVFVNRTLLHSVPHRFISDNKKCKKINQRKGCI